MKTPVQTATSVHHLRSMREGASWGVGEEWGGLIHKVLFNILIVK
jgi:hypothetical protein